MKIENHRKWECKGSQGIIEFPPSQIVQSSRHVQTATNSDVQRSQQSKGVCTEYRGQLTHFTLMGKQTQCMKTSILRYAGVHGTVPGNG